MPDGKTPKMLFRGGTQVTQHGAGSRQPHAPPSHVHGGVYMQRAFANPDPRTHGGGGSASTAPAVVPAAVSGDFFRGPLAWDWLCGGDAYTLDGFLGTMLCTADGVCFTQCLSQACRRRQLSCVGLLARCQSLHGVPLEMNLWGSSLIVWVLPR